MILDNLYELFVRITTPILMDFYLNWGCIIGGHLWVISFFVNKNKINLAIRIITGFVLIIVNIILYNQNA